MLTLKIETTNAAFGPTATDRNNELARILHLLANSLENRATCTAHLLTVRDVNGNKCGTVNLPAFNRDDH